MVGGNVDLFSPKRLPRRTRLCAHRRPLVEVDYREPMNARQGGWYRLECQSVRRSRRRPLQLPAHRSRSAAVHRVPRRSPRDRAARRALDLRAERRQLDVPFYLMPSLGGNDTLRGFRNYRFRGPHALLLQAEYRWEIWSGLDGRCSTTPARSRWIARDLESRRAWSTTTASASGSTPTNGVVMRVDAAFGSRDGKHLHIVFGGVFLRRCVCLLARRSLVAAAVVTVARRAHAALLSRRSAVDRRRHGASMRRRSCRSGRHQRLRLRGQHLLQVRASGATSAR